MKGIHLIAVAFLAIFSTMISAENITEKLPTIFETENECPWVDPCPPKLIRHETDCTKYYECKHRQKLLHTCSAGLYYSKQWRGCVKRQFSDCPYFSTTTTTVIPAIPTVTPGCIHGELLEHECTCTQFYECQYGEKILYDCPPDQHFDARMKTCVPGINCEDPPPRCVEGAHMPHECNCLKFYVCKNGLKALRKCTKGSHFDNATLLCVPGENCDEQPPKCVNDDTKKHCNNCENYYRCVNNKWVLQRCLNGQHFSETQKKCTNPCEANCDPKVKQPGYCSSFSPSRWPHECDCRLYYQCVNGKKKIYECTWGYYFDIDNMRCNVAANVRNCVNHWDKPLVGCK